MFGKIVKAIGDTSTLLNVLIRGSQAIATNGYILAFRDIPANREHLPDGQYAGKAIELASKPGATIERHPELSPERAWPKYDLVTVPGKPSVNYPVPDQSAIFPNVDAVVPEPGSMRITINAQLLLDLAEALQAELPANAKDRKAAIERGENVPVIMLLLHPDRKETDQIYVEGQEGYGVIMPMRNKPGVPLRRSTRLDKALSAVT